MGIGARIWGIRAVAVVLLLGLWPVARVLGGSEVRVVVPGLVAVAALYLLAERWLVRLLWRELADAPKVKAEEILAALGPLQAGDPYATAQLAFHRAALLSHDGKYAEARTLLEWLLESEFATPIRSTVQNNLAWALMHLGITKRALELSSQAVRDGEASRDSGIGFFRGTYAIGLYLDGRAAEAVPKIERVLAEHAADGPEAQAIRAYYLGEALEQLGRKEEAVAAYQRSAREAPGSRWAEQARAKLT